MDKALNLAVAPCACAVAEATAVSARHRQWLRRGRFSGSQKKASWRPKRYHGVAAKKVCRALDDQIRFSMGVSGLKHFQYQDPETCPVWKDDNWANWLYLMAVGDCGPDNVSAMNALLYLFKCCIDFWGDPPHGCNRDTLNALGMASLRQFWSVMLISFKISFGPQNGNGWQNLLDDLMQHLAATYSHSNLPALFLQAAPRMGELLTQQGGVFSRGSG